MAAAHAYPVRVDASLDSPLSRWLWLVKWVLVIPHYIVLAFLWLAFVVLSVVAFFSILVTGVYPRPVFEFNAGVLRWTWRVQYYAIGAFGTDRYPPFTLADDPTYPAHLEIEYPQRLSRGLVLVKWWLLAIPQYIVVGVFTSGALVLTWWYGSRGASGQGWGLIGLLSVIAAIILLFTGRYPEQIFDFVLGMNRWVLRVAAYAGLMTDEYPPFRLDMGGPDPATIGGLGTGVTGGPGTATAGGPGTGTTGGQGTATAGGPGTGTTGGPGTGATGGPGTGATGGPGTGTALPPPRPGSGRRGWTGGRIASVIGGAVLILISLGMLGGGGTALWAQTSQRHGGYVDLGTQSFSTHGYAVTSGNVEMHAAGNGWDLARGLLGKVRISASSLEPSGGVFVGVASTGAANRYLSGVSYSSVQSIDRHHVTYLNHAGGAPTVRPASAGIWAAQMSGARSATVTWQVKSGDWTVVAMNADASQPVGVQMNLAATLPWLPWVAVGLLIAGAAFAVTGVILIVVPVRRAS
jgi:Domain of unknown function (DUF4389)